MAIREKNEILHSRPLLALKFIIETSFFCTIFLIFSAIVIKDFFFYLTTFDNIVAVIQALQFVDELKCQERPRMQDFAPFIPELRPPAVKGAELATSIFSCHFKIY
jgi:hypothetical protein